MVIIDCPQYLTKPSVPAVFDTAVCKQGFAGRIQINSTFQQRHHREGTKQANRSRKKDQGITKEVIVYGQLYNVNIVHARRIKTNSHSHDTAPTQITSTRTITKIPDTRGGSSTSMRRVSFHFYRPTLSSNLNRMFQIW